MDRRTLQRWSYALVAFGGGIALVYLPQLLFPAPGPAGDSAFAAARVAGVILAIAWTGVFGLLGFRKADEYNRERSKFAWYWGSFIGIAVSVPIVALVRLLGLPGLGVPGAADHGLFRAFAAGVALPILAQVLGFGVMTLWWKVTKR